MVDRDQDETRYEAPDGSGQIGWGVERFPVINEVGLQISGGSVKHFRVELYNPTDNIPWLRDSLEAIDLANYYAPEHLCLAITNPETYAARVVNAGCLFLGKNAVEALVDYIAGPSHVLPTEGTARFSSPLNVLDFVKIINVVNTGKADIKKLGPAAAVMAKAEGLNAHARAIEKRLKDIA